MRWAVVLAAVLAGSAMAAGAARATPVCVRVISTGGTLGERSLVDVCVPFEGTTECTLHSFRRPEIGGELDVETCGPRGPGTGSSRSSYVA